MNQRLVESIAQIVAAMSKEEQRLLEAKIQLADSSLQVKNSSEEVKSFEAAEVALGTKASKAEHSVSHSTTDQPPETSHSASVVKSSEDESAAYSFFRTASSLDLDGPSDWSANLDHYLYGLPKEQDG